MTDRLLTVEQLAEMLNCKTSFIYRLNSEHRGPKVVKLGASTCRYRLSDVETWLAERVEGGGK